VCVEPPNKSVDKTKSTNLLESEMAVGLTIALSNKLVPNEYVQLLISIFSPVEPCVEVPCKWGMKKTDA